MFQFRYVYVVLFVPRFSFLVVFDILNIWEVWCYLHAILPVGRLNEEIQGDTEVVPWMLSVNVFRVDSRILGGASFL